MIRRTIVIPLLFAAALHAYAAAPVISKISWQPQILVNGTVCLFTVQVNGKPQRVSAKWLDRVLDFSQGSGETWYSLAGVAFETKPRTYNLVLSATMPDGSVLREVRPIAIHPGRYKTSRLTVPQKYVTPDPETLKRIEAEKEVKAAAFKHEIPEPV